MPLLKTIWTWLVGIKDALLLILLLMLFSSLWALSPLSSPPKSVPKGAALAVNLAGLLVDQPSEVSLIAALAGEQIIPETDAARLVRAIDRAAEDDSIAMLTLDLDGFLGGGQANLEAVANALQRFRKSGKEIEAWATAYGDDGYLLAAHANRIGLSPMGAVLLTGPGGSRLYFKDALDRLKVDIEVFRVGTYKSFVEPYIHNRASDEARLASQQLADDLWADWQQMVKMARPAADFAALLADTTATATNSIDNPAQTALAAGLVDTLESRATWREKLAARLGSAKADMPGDYKRISLADYQAARKDRGSGGTVGIVHVNGMIVDGASGPGRAGGATIAALIRRAIADKEIKSLVVRVDSGGGSALASEEIRQALADARAEKMPVIASFGPVAASGGYWLATGAELILASPSTVTGSIGVFGMIPTFQRSLESLGIHSDGVTTTPYSGQPDIAGGLNTPTRALIQNQVADTYRQFVQLVADSREMSTDAVEKIAEGRVWSGRRALDHGLIDRFGTLEDAISEAARRADLPEQPHVRVIEAPQPLLLSLLSQLSGEIRSHAPAHATGDGLANAMLRSRLKAAAQIDEAMGVARGASIQAQCLGCSIWSVPAVGRLRTEPLSLVNVAKAQLTN